MTILNSLTNGWTGFAFYWLLFLLVAFAEILRPSKRPRVATGDRITVNFALGLLVAAVQMAPFLSAYSAALLVENNGYGVMNILSLTLWVQVVISFFLLDIAGYAFHRASHQLPLLWRLHRIHHSDQTVDASTTFRAHPAAVLAFASFEFVIIGALGIHPMGVLIYTVCKMLASWASHADVAPLPKLSGICARLFVTPAFHHYHHSADQSQTDSNYGEVLTIWDRLFRSISQTAGNVERYGLGDTYDSDAASLVGQLRLPFKSM